jgi:hypothetical protein
VPCPTAIPSSSSTLRDADEKDGRLVLARDGFALLSRFGLDQGAWHAEAGREPGKTGPSESQMRKVLRRVDGCEARERRARKEGYGGG